MIFLLVVSYTILAIITIAFIVFAVNARNVIIGLKEEVGALRKDVQQTQTMYQREIRALLTDFRGMIGK